MNDLKAKWKNFGRPAMPVYHTRRVISLYRDQSNGKGKPLLFCRPQRKQRLLTVEAPLGVEEGSVHVAKGFATDIPRYSEVSLSKSSVENSIPPFFYAQPRCEMDDSCLSLDETETSIVLRLPSTGEDG